MALIVKLNSKRQVTLPARALEALKIEPGDRLELVEIPGGLLLRSRRILPERLAPLRDKIVKGRGRFDLQGFRDQPHDAALRD